MSLIDHVAIPAENVHRMRDEDAPDTAADAYASELVRALDGQPLDLVLLGLGGNGHTASLFPGLAVVTDTKRAVAAYVEVVGMWRLTLTPLTINAARQDLQARAIVTEAKRDEDMRRLTTIPGVGAITAATIKALVPDPGGFKSARHFAAWVGLTPRPHSSGGKERLGGISKMGNPELRVLLVLGATAVLRIARNDDRARPWLKALLARRPFKVAAVALANKMARIIWALLNKGGIYHRPEPLSIAAVAR